eukprot:TRINITY_DN973_c0_g1_i1.p1 TRINITY_DN973_c0_g1~~TRINITY_DN973_c0_g1_i1.p1  ORF type:complete len:283 (-),score=29.46 TRINITY_DN973_c0_g1_i1:1224-2072(-)
MRFILRALVDDHSSFDDDESFELFSAYFGALMALNAATTTYVSFGDNYSPIFDPSKSPLRRVLEQLPFAILGCLFVAMGALAISLPTALISLGLFFLVGVWSSEDWFAFAEPYLLALLMGMTTLTGALIPLNKLILVFLSVSSALAGSFPKDAVANFCLILYWAGRHILIFEGGGDFVRLVLLLCFLVQFFLVAVEVQNSALPCAEYLLDQMLTPDTWRLVFQAMILVNRVKRLKYTWALRVGYYAAPKADTVRADLPALRIIVALITGYALKCAFAVSNLN